MSIRVGDRVQIVNGGLDVTTGASAIAGQKYGAGGPLWAIVDKIDENWTTGGRFNLPSSITKVRCINDGGVVVWQIQPKDISSQIIKSSQPELIQTTPSTVLKTLTPTAQGSIDLGSELSSNTTMESTAPRAVNEPSYEVTATTSWEMTEFKTQVGSHSAIGNGKEVKYNSAGNKIPAYQAADNIRGVSGLMFDGTIQGQKTETAFSDSTIRRQMLKEDTENIQNAYGFPIKSKNSERNIAAKYNYQIQVGDPKYPMMITLEDKLRDARASLGLPVHGRQDIARAMKYYMYNRFKTPDTNMAYNKSTTHVFFTRPDLNLLRHKNAGGGANRQIRDHSESSILWRRNPDLFKLLTNNKRCGDRHNFNLLLSNQVTSFDIQDEQLSTIEAGRTWDQYEMIYGDTYMGRAAGEFSCNFVETNDYSVIHLIKLWITYIDNVSKGAWSPSYNLLGGDGVSTSRNASHVYSKTLDYAADAYVFKCGPDGSDILYWSKYYGIIPVNTGASALSWDINQPIGDVLKPNIRFKYVFKKDMSPISLLEFNGAANVSGATVYQQSYNVNVAQSSRPYVGAPFIEMNLEKPSQFPSSGGASIGSNSPRSTIRLRFLPDSENNLSDDVIYRASLANR